MLKGYFQPGVWGLALVARRSLGIRPRPLACKAFNWVIWATSSLLFSGHQDWGFLQQPHLAYLNNIEHKLTWSVIAIIANTLWWLGDEILGSYHVSGQKFRHIFRKTKFENNCMWNIADLERLPLTQIQRLTCKKYIQISCLFRGDSQPPNKKQKIESNPVWSLSLSHSIKYHVLPNWCAQPANLPFTSNWADKVIDVKWTFMIAYPIDMHHQLDQIFNIL